MTIYQPLPDIVEKLVLHLRAGENVILSGHRRIGKTLLMQHLEQHRPEDLIPTYLIVESVNSVNEFYRRLVDHICEQFNSPSEEVQRKLGNWLKTINIEEIGRKIRFRDPKQIDYIAEFRKLLDRIKPDRPIVLMLDEFPQAIENIRNRDDGVAQVQHLLTTQREFRQEPRYKSNIRFIYAGSIGLQNVVEGMGFTKHINDLKEVKMRPFEPEEAERYLDNLLSHKKLVAAPHVSALILGRILWLAPFFIDLLVDELTRSPIQTAHIDEAFNALLDHRNNFEHWHGRLRPPALKPEEYRFCKAVLNAAADPGKPGIDRADIYNLAVTHSVLDEVPRLMKILSHDGYLNRDRQNLYRYISPVVRAWWWREIAN